MKRITLAVLMLAFVAGITLLLFFTKTEKGNDTDISVCISNQTFGDTLPETTQNVQHKNKNTTLTITNMIGKAGDIHNSNPEDTLIETTQNVQSNNMTLTITNMIGEVRNIHIDSDTAKYAEYVKIAFVSSRMKTPDRVKTIVENKGETIIVTFVEIYDDIYTDGAGYCVIVDVKTKTVLDVFEEPN